MRNLFRRRLPVTGLFSGHYVDVRAMYLQLFDTIPSIGFVGEIDLTQAYAHIERGQGPIIENVLQHRYYDHDEGRVLFNNTVFVLQGQRIIELANSACHVLHTADHFRWANDLITDLAAMRVVVPSQAPAPVIGFARQMVEN